MGVNRGAERLWLVAAIWEVCFGHRKRTSASQPNVAGPVPIGRSSPPQGFGTMPLPSSGCSWASVGKSGLGSFCAQTRRSATAGRCRVRPPVAAAAVAPPWRKGYEPIMSRLNFRLKPALTRVVVGADERRRALAERRSTKGLDRPSGSHYGPSDGWRGAIRRVASGIARFTQRDGSMNPKLKSTFDDLAEYSARVETARLLSSAEIIYNSSHRHAAVLIENLFLSAKQRVRIVCRELSLRSYGRDEVIAAAEVFLAREGAELSVLVEKIELPVDEKGNPGVNPFVDAIRRLPGVVVEENGTAVDVPFDFLVADEVAWRFEPNHHQSVARASFNEPSMAADLVELFDLMWDRREAA